jgi:hypothetical protein
MSSHKPFSFFQNKESGLKWIVWKREWGMDWIHVAEDRDKWWVLVNTIMNIWVSLNFGEFLGSLATVDFSRRAQLHGDSLISSANAPQLFFCACIISYEALIRIIK